MEKTLANISKQEKKDEKRLEKIVKAGFSTQNSYLISKGFEKLGKNLKALRKTKGDQEEALKILQNKQTKKNEKQNSLNEKIKAQNFEEQMNYLVSKGFKKLKKNLKLLSRFSGDQEKALLQLSQPKNKPNFDEKIKGLGFEKENSILLSHGFSNLKKNLKLLQLYEGKVERVLNHFNHNKAHKYEQLLKIIEEKGLEKENQALMELGFTKLKKNLKLLIKHKGDVARVREDYNQKKEAKLQDLRILCKTKGVQPQFESLVIKGFKPNKVVKLLKMYQWDAEKTVKHLESGKNKNAAFEAKIKELEFEEQNKALVEKGHKNLKKNLKLLQMNEGKVEAILEVFKNKSHKGEKIDKKLAKLNFTQQYHEILAKDGSFKPKKVLKVLTKVNGNVKEALNQLERKKLNKEFSVDEWPVQAHILYLDGNNMLFANSNIRKLYLTKKKKEAELLLHRIARNFSVKKQLERTVLMFDRGTEAIKSEEITLENKKTLNFEVRVAKEEKNADDALVALLEKDEHAKNAVVVTADLELRRRLIEKGVKTLMGPKQWFGVAKTVLGEEYDQ